MATRTMDARTRSGGRSGSHGLALLWRGLTVEMVGIALAALAFGPYRGAAFALAVPALGLVYLGMVLALVGAVGGYRGATRGRTRGAYLVGALAAVAQIAGLTWDNILHAQGETHFGPAHNLASGGFVGLLLVALGLALGARLGRQARA